jgi:hypothetical protein
MKTTWISGCLTASLILFLAGCKEAAPQKKSEAAAAPSAEETKVQANLAKLSEEDRKLAEEQHFCAIEDENLLGSMGAPIKILIKDQPVFLCCKGCKKQAEADPDKTLAKVKALREKKAAKPAS